MKLFNIFKKETKNTVNSTIQKLEKNQLEKVIGGTEVIRTDKKIGASQNSQTL